MASNIVGLQFGAQQLYMAQCSEAGMQAAVVADLPDGLVKDGRITSLETATDAIRQALAENGVKAKYAALVLPSYNVYTRRVTVPVMTESELALNLPYEFKDYLADASEQFTFDYAVMSTITDEAGAPQELEILAACVNTEIVTNYAAMLKRAGLKLSIATPNVMAYSNLFNRLGEQRKQDYCFLDVDATTSRVYLFPAAKYEITRHIDFGTENLVAAIASHFNVEAPMARQYMDSNFDNCLSIPECTQLYDKLATEMQRIVSFFGFNYPQSNLDTIYYGGKGALVEPMIAMLRENVTVAVEGIGTLVPQAGAINLNQANLCACAAGITMQ
ncbi:MAG: pilus assembly protein PilM [Coriobacteriia bacterium]|nr:pilus assembly protein PilM [Coriobacteriia bacterium]